MKRFASLAVLLAQETHRVSVDSAGAESNGPSTCTHPCLSGDGRFVAFASSASNLVAGDTNGCWDLFVHDRATGITERVSVDSAGVEGNGDVQTPFAITPDGRFVAFSSLATNLVASDGNQTEDVFVHDRQTGVTERVSVDSAGGEAAGGKGVPGSNFPAISADGRLVAFTSFAIDLVAGDTNHTYDVFVHDRTTGATERVSTDALGTQQTEASFTPSLSADGSLVAFCSKSGDLVSSDLNGEPDCFVRDLTTGWVERVSVDSTGSEVRSPSLAPVLSADGRIVAFTSPSSQLVANDNNNDWDVFVHDRTTGSTDRVSVDSNGAEAAGTSDTASLSDDGRLVVFESTAPNLAAGDANGFYDVFLHDRATGTTTRKSVDSSGVEADHGALFGSVSGDGLVVAFFSDATNLVANDANALLDVFVHVDCTAASSTNYGVGVVGTNGVPFLTSQLPVLGSSLTVDVGNSLGAPTTGLFFLGYGRAQLPTHFGGDLLLLPSLVVPLSFSFGADSFTGNLPDDDVLCGFVVDLQAVEADPGAVKGLSFTQGLELVLGR